jgi:hypothetical protein
MSRYANCLAADSIPFVLSLSLVNQARELRPGDLLQAARRSRQNPLVSTYRVRDERISRETLPLGRALGIWQGFQLPS